MTLTGEIGAMGIYKSEVEARLNQRLCKLSIRNEKDLLLEYVHYFLSSPSARQSMWQMSKGAAQPNISVKDIATLLIPVPSLEEQHRIVEALNEQLFRLDTVFAKLENVDSQTLVFRGSILNSLLNSRVSGSHPGADGKSPKFSISKLCEVADFVMGQAPPSSETNTQGEGTPFVQVRNFGNPVPRIEEWTTKPLKMAAKGDVLVCIVGATVGKVNLGIEAAITRSIAAIRPKPALLDQRYLFHWMFFNMLQLRSQSSGSAQGIISKEQLASLEIPLRSLNEQKRTVETLDEYLSRLDSARAIIASHKALLQNLRRSILNQAFKSESGAI
jgi:restriction endonuclease S subunit